MIQSETVDERGGPDNKKLHWKKAKEGPIQVKQKGVKSVVWVKGSQLNTLPRKIPLGNNLKSWSWGPESESQIMGHSKARNFSASRKGESGGKKYAGVGRVRQ